MNGFQRRLIYQLVRKEFPEYRAKSRDSGAFMKIELADLEEEARVRSSITVDSMNAKML